MLESMQANIEQHEDAPGLISHGSVGLARKRHDQYSNINFFLIVRDGKKDHFLENPQRLEVVEGSFVFCFETRRMAFN